jgi:hypothetical protein
MKKIKIYRFTEILASKGFTFVMEQMRVLKVNYLDTAFPPSLSSLFLSSEGLIQPDHPLIVWRRPRQ